MTEQIRRQISLFMDDELSTEQCEFFVRRLQHDNESRNLYMRYQLIGAAIRGEHAAAGHDALRARLQSALVPPRDGASWKSRFGARPVFKAAAGIGIAASVALASILVLKGNAVLDPGEPLVASQGIERRLEPVETPSYVVPLQVPEPPVVTPEVRLTGLQYLMHHSGHASGFSRTVVHSNMLSADSEDIIDVVEASTQ